MAKQKKQKSAPAPAPAVAELKPSSKHYIEQFAREQDAQELSSNTGEPLDLVTYHQREVLGLNSSTPRFAVGKGAVSMTEAQSAADDDRRRLRGGNGKQIPPKLADCVHKIRPDEPIS